MDQYITADSLKKIGVNLDGKDVASLLKHLNDTLEERIGAEITDALDDKQLEVLVDMQEKASDEEIGAWLKANVPDFEDIVQDEIDIILGDLAESTDGINEAA
jgi:hypothetical protein